MPRCSIRLICRFVPDCIGKYHIISFGIYCKFAVNSEWFLIFLGSGLAKNVLRSALKDSRNWKDFSSNLKSYGIKAEIKFRSGTTIPQGISFTRNGTTFKGSSLDRSLSFSRIDKVLTGGMNIDSNGQSQAPSVHESRSPEQNQSMTSDLANIASELAIGLISSGQEKKSEEEDFAPKKKRGIRL